LQNHQYHPEDGCDGHELVSQEGESFPIANVWFTKDFFDSYTPAEAAGNQSPSPPPDASAQFDAA
jgi:hypothetical protein